MKKLIGVLVLVILLSGCADYTDIEQCLSTEYIYGFWSGLWHGAILVFSLVGSAFSDDIAIYAVNNSGAWYDIGFVIGTGAFSKIFSVTITK